MAAGAAGSDSDAESSQAPAPAECDCQEEQQPDGDEKLPAAHSSNEDPLQQIRNDISKRTAALLDQGPTWLAQRTLNEFNAEAAQLQKAGEYAAAVAVYHALFAKARRTNVTHPELYICHSNCAAAYLRLGLYTEAAQQADRCQTLAYGSMRRNYKGCASYIKSFLRKGEALLGLGANREAVIALEKGLEADPFNLDLKKALMDANQAVLRDLAEGRGRERKAIEYPEAKQRISYHPYAAPLHRIKTDDMLPLKLLTPFQAENDHHIKDTYNYLTIQTDIRMPKRHLRVLEDAAFNGPFQQAIEAAVKDVMAEDKDCRVLNLGSGAGLHAMMALRAGAHHVTAVERWLYLALASLECLSANKFTEDRFKVVYKRPTDLKLKEDVPVCCNLLVANIFDEGLLTSGIIPSMRHALGSLLTSDAILMPSSATVYVQAVQLRTGDVCGFDMSAVNLYRWHPAYAAGTPLAKDNIVALSEPKEVWYFDMGAPPDKSDVKTLDLEFTRAGRFNAVLFWYKLHLYGDVYLCTGPQAVGQGLRCLQPALQYIAGELAVEEGLVLPLVASHNTVRMRFDVESSEFLNLIKPDASFPNQHFSMLADERRCQAYQRAIQRAVRQRREQDGEAHVLDIGSGTGILSLMAARAGANSVVACDLHDSLCDVATKAASANKLSKQISVVARDAAMLQRGREVRPMGANLVVADMFDSGLLADGFAWLLELTQRKVVTPGATVVPSAATLYCMGIEALTGHVAGFNMTPMNTFRWDSLYETISLADMPHRRLTKPCKVFEHFFDGERKGKSRESMLRLDVVAEGVMNAVVFWFDLHLDDCETLTNAPDGIGEGGVVLAECGGSACGDAAAAATAPADAGAEGGDGDGKAAVATSPTSVCQQEELVSSVSTASTCQPDAERDAELAADDFLPAGSFAGARPGYVFKLGELGQGYYLDGRLSAAAADAAGEQAPGTAASAADAVAEATAQPLPTQEAQTGAVSAEGVSAADAQAGAAAAGGTATVSDGSSAKDAAAKPAEPPGAAAVAITAEAAPLPPLGPGPRHYWGQALQYLERAVAVQPGRKLALLARREDGRVKFSLRQGVGEYVERPPWKVEWGGGSSIENPHFQRVHYCQLLVTDFLQRVRCKRFPPIEKDMKMVLAHSGSLLLDPAALQEVYHNMVMLEKLHQVPEFSPATTVEAITKRPLRLH